jgi:hypothetical protein
MSFAKNVNKYYKWVLGAIVAVLAIALVVPGTVGQDDGDRDKPHATIFGSVTVTQKEWVEAWNKAGAWYRLKVVRKIDEGTDYESQQIGRFLFDYQGRPGMLAWHEPFKPTPEDRTAAARELIILGYDARAKQVRATDMEVDDALRALLERANVPLDDVDAQTVFADQYFLASRDGFKAAVRDSILIEKSMNLEVGGCHSRYESVFDDKLAASRSVRVLVAGIDGANLAGDLVPVTDDAIRAKFETEKENYKMPAKVQVEYLMVAFEDLKKKFKEPTPAEIQKYYDDHKREFAKAPVLEEGHHEGDGHDHGQAKEEFKPLAEVREEIIKKIQDQQASREGWELIRGVSSRNFAERWYKLLEDEKTREPKDQKAVRERALARTAPILGELREQLKSDGVELRNGITMPFDTNEREPFEKELGKATGDDASRWAFEAPVGEVAHQVYRSDKGFAILRLANKFEGYSTDLTGPIREKIRQELGRDGAGDRARRLADELVIRLRANGAAEVARLKNRNDLKIQHSLYITKTSPDGESGLMPATLASQIKTKMLKPEGTPGSLEAEAIYGSLVSGDRKDWAYVVVVEDSVQIAPDVKEEDFLADVRKQEAQELAKARVTQANQLVANAGWTDAAK